MSEHPIPTHAASERHSNSGEIIRDLTIGFADGMTVPFALTAGLSSSNLKACHYRWSRRAVQRSYLDGTGCLPSSCHGSRSLQE